jgi:hypothetical protein
VTTPTFGVFYAGAGTWVTAEGARALALGAEEHGFSALWAIDHAVLPTGFAPRYEEAGGASPPPLRLPGPRPAARPAIPELAFLFRAMGGERTPVAFRRCQLTNWRSFSAA